MKKQNLKNLSDDELKQKHEKLFYAKNYAIKGHFVSDICLFLSVVALGIVALSSGGAALIAMYSITSLFVATTLATAINSIVACKRNDTYQKEVERRKQNKTVEVAPEDTKAKQAIDEFCANRYSTSAKKYNNKKSTYVDETSFTSDDEFTGGMNCE